MASVLCIRCDAKFDDADDLPVPCPYCGLSIGYIRIEDAATMRVLMLDAMKNPNRVAAPED